MPESLREARVHPGRHGALIVCAIATVAALAALIGVWWSAPAATPVAGPPARVAPSDLDRSGSPSLPVGGESPESSAPDTSTASAPPSTATATPLGPILVSVTGRVHHPGVVTVRAGARVADAIAAAGGAIDPTDLTGLNLAAHLTDGASIVVAGPAGSRIEGGARGEAAPAEGASVAGEATTVNINTADQATLQRLPGIGPVTAAAIVSYREDHGPFAEGAQLEAVSGIGPATYAQIADHITW